jgi:hypothetical protein
MTQDKELLELAAKAAGIKALRSPDGILRDCTGGHPMMNIFAANPWSPLTDDGDALRLAVKLNISVWVDAWDACCSWVPDGQNQFTEGMQQLAEQITNGDPYAATRRAIVKAAAEIGKTK